MDQESHSNIVDQNPQLPPGGASAATPPLLKTYQGNQYDVYALVAGTLGGSVLAMCLSGGAAYYCLPIAPLVLGIVALRHAKTAADPQRTRNLAWVGIAGGGLGMLLTLFVILLLICYFVFIFAMILTTAAGSQRY